MNTWNDELPPELPPATPGGRIAGILRLAAFLTLTFVCVALFLCGRFLHRRVSRQIRFHFLVAKLWARASLWLLGLRLCVRGRPIEAGALVANHSSWIDIMSLRSVTLIYFVAKSEVRSWPIVGLITHICGTIYIERRRSQAKRQEEALRERIAESQLLCFFPEATSTDGLRVLPFKSSLFSVFFHDGEGESDGRGADLLVQPVTVRYRPPPGSALPPSFHAWWGDMSLERHIWAVMSRSFGGRADVVFHEPVNPRDFPNRKALAEHCQAVVALGMEEGVPHRSNEVGAARS